MKLKIVLERMELNLSSLIKAFHIYQYALPGQLYRWLKGHNLDKRGI